MLCQRKGGGAGRFGDYFLCAVRTGIRWEPPLRFLIFCFSRVARNRVDARRKVFCWNLCGGSRFYFVPYAGGAKRRVSRRLLGFPRHRGERGLRPNFPSGLPFAKGADGDLRGTKDLENFKLHAHSLRITRYRAAAHPLVAWELKCKE